CPTKSLRHNGFATLRDLFRFLLVFPLVRLAQMAFFFFSFFVLENNFERGNASKSNGLTYLRAYMDAVFPDCKPSGRRSCTLADRHSGLRECWHFTGFIAT